MDNHNPGAANGPALHSGDATVKRASAGRLKRFIQRKITHDQEVGRGREFIKREMRKRLIGTSEFSRSGTISFPVARPIDELYLPASVEQAINFSSDSARAAVKAWLAEIEPMLSTRAAATFLGTSCEVLKKWRQRKKTGPKYVRVGRAIQYRYSELIRFRDEHTFGPTAVDESRSC